LKPCELQIHRYPISKEMVHTMMELNEFELFLSLDDTYRILQAISEWNTYKEDFIPRSEEDEESKTLTHQVFRFNLFPMNHQSHLSSK
jgi:hypothetical protein